MKKKIKKFIPFIVVVVLLALFVVMAILFKSTSVPMKGNADKEAWKEDAANNDYVVTVIGTTWCPNCQVYKPIIQSVKDKYDINVYFFEVDELSEEESEDLTSTFELTGYEGSIPYTAVISKGVVIANTSGRMPKEDLVEFLKEAGVIK